MGTHMNREEFAQFLGKLREINNNGGDVDAFVKEHEHRNVYFYNDGCIKKILASEKNIMLTTDLVNAALGLIGSDRITNPKLVNPFIPGELGYRGVEPDILLTNDRDGDTPRDRISIEVQHEDKRAHHFMANRWGNSGNSDRLYFWGLQNQLQMVTASMKLKDACSLEEKL